MKRYLDMSSGILAYVFTQGILWVESYAGAAFSDFFKFLRIIFFIQIILASAWYFGVAIPSVAGSSGTFWEKIMER